MRRKELLYLALGVALFGLACGLVAGASLTPQRAAAAVAAQPGNTSGPAQARPETLVVHLFFKNTVERDFLATEWGAGEMPTDNGYLTVWADRPTYNQMIAQGLRVEIDQATTRLANDPHLFGQRQPDHLLRRLQDRRGDADLPRPAGRRTTRPWPKGGYRQLLVQGPPRLAPSPRAYNGYDLLGAAHHQPGHRRPQAGLLVRRRHPLPRNRHARNGHALSLAGCSTTTTPTPMPTGWWTTTTSGSCRCSTPTATISSRRAAAAAAPITSARTRITPTAAPPGRRAVSTQFGTDNNRNFPFLWDCCGGSSGSPCTQTYRGPSAGSEPETQAVMNQDPRADPRPARAEQHRRRARSPPPASTRACTPTPR